MEIGLGSLSSLLLLAEIYGFRPDEDWMILTGLVSIHASESAHFWWELEVLIRTSGFSVAAQERLAAALARFESEGPERVNELSNPHAYDSWNIALRRVSREIPRVTISEVIQLCRDGPWSWKADSAGRFISIVKGSSAPPLQVSVPLEIPPEDRGLSFARELTIDFEVSRLGKNVQAETRHKPPRCLVLTYEAWVNVMLTAVLYGYIPQDPRWQKWQQYYAFRNPSRKHFVLNTGFLRIPIFSPVETVHFVRSLSTAQGDGIARAAMYLNDNQVTDHGIGLGEAGSRVSPLLLDQVIQVGKLGHLAWTAYRNGDVALWCA